MRKDVKLGLAVGAILAVVIVAYAVFFNSNKDKPKDSGPVAIKPPPTNPLAAPDNRAPRDPDPAPTRNDTPDRTSTPPTPPVTPPSDNSTDPVTRIPPPTDGGRTMSWQEFLTRGDPTGNLVHRTETPDPGRGNPGPTDRRNSDSGNTGNNNTGNSNNTGTPGGTTPPPDPSAPRKYVVQSGDSYWSISQKEFGSGAYVAHLMRANPNFPPARLRPGISLVIPAKNEVIPEDHAPPRATPPAALDAAKQYKVVAGDNLTVISKKLYGNISKIDAIYEANKALIGPNRSALKVGMVLTLPEPPTASASVN